MPLRSEPFPRLQMLQQPQECPVLWERGTASPGLWHRGFAFTGHPGGTLGTLRDSWPALLTLQTVDTACLQCEPSAKALRGANTTSLPVPAPRLRAELGKAPKPSTAALGCPSPLHPELSHALTCSSTPCSGGKAPKATAAEDNQQGKGNPGWAGGSASRETSQQSAAVSEWEGKRKPGNTWVLQPDPGPSRVLEEQKDTGTPQNPEHQEGKEGGSLA